MNRATLRNIVIIGFTCFVLGAVFARPVVSLLKPEPTEVISSTASINTVTYTIILIDDFTSAKPQVDGVWLAWIPADYSTVELIGIPPAPYRDQYSHEIRGIPSFTIQQNIQGSLAGSIILDRSDMAALADQLGGVLLEGNRVSGEAIVSYYNDSRLDHQARLFRQAAVFQSFIAQVALKGTSVSFETLLQFPSLNTIQYDALYETVRHYYPLRTEQIKIRTLLDS